MLILSAISAMRSDSEGNRITAMEVIMSLMHGEHDGRIGSYYGEDHYIF